MMFKTLCCGPHQLNLCFFPSTNSYLRSWNLFSSISLDIRSCSSSTCIIILTINKSLTLSQLSFQQVHNSQRFNSREREREREYSYFGSKPEQYKLICMFMARGGFTTPNLLLFRSYREANRGRSTGVSKICCGAKGEERYEVSEEGGGDSGGGGPVWVPHTRTGIYMPKGQEGVMKDVPENAATFTAPYWFRNDDDLNHPNP